MRENQKHSRPYLKTIRKDLRTELTYAEAVLWSFLKNKQINGRKFRRQHSIENYIVDFYCASEKLIIEVDGSSHDNLGQTDADELRDQKLEKLGFRTLRLENNLVIDYPDEAIDLIKNCFFDPEPPPTPS